jgi:hypothetical protein
VYREFEVHGGRGILWNLDSLQLSLRLIVSPEDGELLKIVAVQGLLSFRSTAILVRACGYLHQDHPLLSTNGEATID